MQITLTMDKCNMAGKKSWMHRNCDANQFRPEQYYCYKLLFELMPPNFEITMEYPVKDLKDVDGILSKNALLDIAVISKEHKFAFRLNGEVHEKKRQAIKDKDQRIILEGNGWKVYDLNKYSIPELWDRNQYTKEEAKLALLREIKNGKV